MDIDDRISDLDRRKAVSTGVKKKDSLKNSLVTFLINLPGKPSLIECSPNDVRRFLVWKDGSGKNKVHQVQCEFLGSKGKTPCGCPLRLASGTVGVLVQYLVDSLVGKVLGHVGVQGKSSCFSFGSGLFQVRRAG